jgi:homogentisate 1,2-dioxygenase
MIESCWPYRATAAAMADAQPGYDAVWGDFPKARLPD